MVSFLPLYIRVTSEYINTSLKVTNVSYKMHLRRSVTFLANPFAKYLSVEKTLSQSEQWLTSPVSNDATFIV